MEYPRLDRKEWEAFHLAMQKITEYWQRSSTVDSMKALKAMRDNRKEAWSTVSSNAE